MPPNVARGPPTPDVVYPDGYQLGRELGIDTGEIVRHRAFYIFDRTIPVGFQRGQDLNADKAILRESVYRVAASPSWKSNGLAPIGSSASSAAAAWGRSTRGSTARRASRPPSSSSPPRLAQEEGFRIRFEAEIETPPQAQPSEHRPAVRLRRAGGAPVLCDGTGRRQQPGGGIAARAAFRVARGDADRHRDLPGPAPRPRPRHHPPRHQAGQPAADGRRPREALRLRHRPALRQHAADQRRQRVGHGRIHGPGAGRGAAGGHAGRPVQPGRADVRPAGPAAGVSRQVAARDAAQAAVREAGAGPQARPRRAGGTGSASSANCWRKTPAGGFPTPTFSPGGWKPCCTR